MHRDFGGALVRVVILPDFERLALDGLDVRFVPVLVVFGFGGHVGRPVVIGIQPGQGDQKRLRGVDIAVLNELPAGDQIKARFEVGEGQAASGIRFAAVERAQAVEVDIDCQRLGQPAPGRLTGQPQGDGVVLKVAGQRIDAGLGHVGHPVDPEGRARAGIFDCEGRRLVKVDQPAGQSRPRKQRADQKQARQADAQSASPVPRFHSGFLLLMQSKNSVIVFSFCGRSRAPR